MIQSFIHTTENNNSYIYDDRSRLSILIHPELIKVHENSGDVNSYYRKKYAYLKKHRFFTEIKLAKFESISEQVIQEGIVQNEKILFEVTDSCNLNCTYCGYGDLYEVFDTRNHNNINIHNAKIFFEYIYTLKLKSDNKKLMIGFYGGEPLLNIYFIKQIVELANKLNIEKKIDINYSMTTNATLIHKYIDFLVENEFEILISLDGNEENHSYRIFSKSNKNSFGKVIDNVDLIQTSYPEYFVNKINFNAVLHNRNSVREVYEFIYTRYHKIPIISELLSSTIKPNKKSLFEKMYRNHSDSEADYEKEKSIKIPGTRNKLILFGELKDFLEHFSVNYYLSNTVSLFNLKEKYLPSCTCLPFSVKIFLTVQNKLLPCERISHKYSLGRVSENVIIDVQEIARQYNSYYDHLKKICQYCYAYKFCGLCMFRIENLDKSDTEEILCNRFYDQKAFKNKLHRIFSFLEKFPKDFFSILENENNN